MGKSFNPTNEEIQNAIYGSGYDEVPVQHIKDRIEAVKNGSQLNEYDNHKEICILSELCDRKDIILETIDAGSDRGFLLNALTVKNKELIQKAAKELE